MTTIGVVQARFNSTRMPGKVLADLNGRPVLEHGIRAMLASKLLEHVVVATTVRTDDDAVVSLAQRTGAEVVRGAESDVLGRFLVAAERYGADAIVRITGDCPAVDPGVVDAAVTEFRDGRHDYVTAGESGGFPRGLDVEVVSAAALDLAGAEADIEEREHVTLFAYRRPSRFRLGFVAAPEPLRAPDLRLCVDEPADLEFLRELCRRLGTPTGSLPDIPAIRQLLRAHPEVRSINSSVEQTVVDITPRR